MTVRITTKGKIFRFARHLGVALLVLAALPTFAVAGEAIKEVVVTNTEQNPVPVRGIGTQQVTGSVEIANRIHDLRSGGGYASRSDGGDVLLPDDIVLTDLVITLVQSAATGVCEVALFEDPGVGDLQSVVGFYPTTEDRTEQLHLESGLRPRPSWGVTVNNDCVVQVFWTGYALR